MPITDFEVLFSSHQSNNLCEHQQDLVSVVIKVIQPQVLYGWPLLRLHPSHESHRGNRPPEG